MPKEVDFLSQEIFSRYGIVKRARGCFLYTAKGVRLTDLYQEGGRAILGWEGSSAFTMFKNTMNRGVTGSFETGFAYRTKKAVQELFDSKREVFFYSGHKTALKASLLFSKTGTNQYRPWSKTPINWKDCDSIIFVPPFPWAQDLYIVAVKPELVSSIAPELLPEQITIPAPMHAGLARSIYDLITALDERQEKNFFIYDTVINKYWERKGPYLFPKVPENEYKNFMLHCLGLGIVISPFYNEPSIVPFGADAGNFTSLKNNPFVF